MEHGADHGTDLAEFMGRRTLIVGDVNAGKTTLTQRILDAFCREGLGPCILVLDLAPEIPQEIAARRGLAGVGGRLLPPQNRDLIYVWARPRPPRLSASIDEEATAMARRNLECMEELFRAAACERRDIVILNDVSLYLQAGSAGRLMQWIRSASTIVANGYYGEKLGQGLFSERERAEMEALMGFFDRVIRLEP